MIGLRRFAGLPCSLLLCSVPALAAPADLEETFEQGVDYLLRGSAHDDEALRAFQDVLAMDPDPRELFELWIEADPEAWSQMVLKGGQFELVFRDLMRIIREGQRDLRDDPAAIQERLNALVEASVAERLRLARELATFHGPYVVPYMLDWLSAGASDEESLLAITTLDHMGRVVVLPLLELFESDDAVLRRNVAVALGAIGDRRAAGVLALVVKADPAPTVRSAATHALAQIGGTSGNATQQLLRQAEAFNRRDPSVVSSFDQGTSVWSFEDGELLATRMPDFLYYSELAKKFYFKALDSEPSSIAALAGIARVSVAEAQHLDRLARADGDVGEVADWIEADALAAPTVGTEALDLALQSALDQSDETAAAGLCRLLGRVGKHETDGLRRALQSEQSALLRAEAALAIAQLALEGNASAGPGVVSALGVAASRESLVVAGIVDADAERSARMAEGLRAQGMLVHQWSSGLEAIATLYRAPGIDLVLVADRLEDKTANEMLDFLRSTPVYAETPVWILTEDPERADELYGEAASGTVTSSADLDVLAGAVPEEFTGGRGEARGLAIRSAEALAALARRGVDVSPALDELAARVSTATDDEVAQPSIDALGAGGSSPQHVEALVAVARDASRSDATRAAAAHAIGAIAARHPAAGEPGFAPLQAIVADESVSGEIRRAAALGLSRMAVDPTQRGQLLRALRAGR